MLNYLLLTSKDRIEPDQVASHRRLMRFKKRNVIVECREVELIPKDLDRMEPNLQVFEEAVARAEKLGAMAQETAEDSKKALRKLSVVLRKRVNQPGKRLSFMRMPWRTSRKRLMR